MSIPKSSRRMDRFVPSNPGLRSRIAHHIDFPDDSDKELMALAETMMQTQNYHFKPGGEAAFAGGAAVSLADLSTIEAEDVFASRVFAGASRPETAR